MIPDYDLSNRTPVTIDTLETVGFVRSKNSRHVIRGFSNCSYKCKRGGVYVYFRDGKFTHFMIYSNDMREAKLNDDMLRSFEVEKVTVETLLWLIDVFLSEE